MYSDDFYREISEEDLQKLVRGDQNSKSPHFLHKIFHLLSFSKFHPDQVNNIGIFWGKEKGSMITNSMMIGNFLNKKPNSINKNFQMFGITIKSNTVGEALPFFTICKKNWRSRLDKKHCFTQDTLYDEIEHFHPVYKYQRQIYAQNINRLPMLLNQYNSNINSNINDNNVVGPFESEYIPYSPIIESSFDKETEKRMDLFFELGSNLFENNEDNNLLIPSDSPYTSPLKQTKKADRTIKDESLIYSLIPSFCKIKDRESEWKIQFLQKFWECWNDIPKNSQNSELIHLTESIIPNDDIENSKRFNVDCFRQLLKFFTNNSDHVSPDYYFIFCTYFGLEKQIEVINDLSADSQNMEVNSPFAEWFMPTIYDAKLQPLMNMQNDGTWTTCFSKEPGYYFVIKKCGNSLQRLPIRFDPLTREFHLRIDDMKWEKFYKISDIVFKFLQLNVENCLSITRTHLAPLEICVDKFINIKYETEKNLDFKLWNTIEDI